MKVKQSIQRYLSACKRYKWAGLAGFACLVTLAGSIAAFRPESKTLYTAQKLLLYQPSTAKDSTAQPATSKVAVSEEDAAKSEEDANISSETSPNLSDSLLNRTAEKLQVRSYSLPPETLRRHLTLKQDTQQEDRWLVQFQDEQEERSAAVVESFTEAIVQQDLTEKRQDIESAVQLLEQRRDLIRDELRLAEEKLQEFSSREKPAIQQAVDGSLVSAITTIQQQQRELDRTLEGTEAEMTSLQNQLRMTPEQAYLAAAISADAVVTTLSTKIDELALQQQEQLRELQPQHPEIVALQHQQSVNESRLQQRIQEIARGDRANTISIQSWRALNLDKARQELANRLVSLKSQRDRLTQEVAILSRSEPELRRNYSDGTGLRLELEKLTSEVARYREASEQTGKELAAAELKQAETRSDWVSKGAPQVKPESNWLGSRPFVLGVGSGLGLLVAGITVLLVDWVRGRVLTPEEVQFILQKRVPLLGILPSIETSKSPIPILINSESTELQSYELFRSSILHHSPDRSPKIVMLSSIHKGEGKTVSAYNLAIAAAQAGKKTLLVEADLRTSSQANVLGVDIHPDKALSNDAISLDQIQPAAHIKNLFVLPNSGNIKQVTEVLESSKTQRLFEHVRNDFDFVVIDATTLCFSDVLLMESFTDGLILVTRLGHSERKGLKLVIEKITQSKSVTLLGTVINDVAKPTKYAPLLSL